MAHSLGFQFAWEGANAPRGPWLHLLVVEARGVEGLNQLYDYEIDLVRAEGAPDVRAEELLGAKATLRVRTLLEPSERLVHGVVSEVEHLGVWGEGRYRVRLSPPFYRACMMRKSVVWVDKTLQQILDATLARGELGMALEPSASEGEGEAAVDDTAYRGFRSTFQWRCVDLSRLADPNARPYCVQYEETDVAFVSRLLEEEGIAYHFEHTPDECMLVLSDHDMAKQLLGGSLTLSVDGLHREIRDMRLGGRLVPQSALLSDYDWRKPDLDLTALSPFGRSPFMTCEQPGRYGHSREMGENLARIREEALDAERLYARVTTSCRLLSAGVMFAVEHPADRFSGTYLVRRLHVRLRQRASFADVAVEAPTYQAEVEALWCAAPGGEPRSLYRPACLTARPKVHGTQTAVVTAEAGQDQEINVGGPADVGCVRVRFHWDRDAARHRSEPTSCWLRVSQMFAGGRGHGAMFHPRVGDEVVVDYLEGDPDQPIITGRVYNGRNLSPENATSRPTYSCIKSMTSPFNGNYNMIAFDDLQNEEKFIVHAARDYIEEILHDSSRSVANFDTIKVFGDQSVWIKGSQTIEVLSPQTILVRSDQTTVITGHQTYTVGAGLDLTVVGTFAEKVSGTKVEMAMTRTATIQAMDSLEAPLIQRRGASIVDQGTTITVNGSVITISGGHVTVKGDNVDVVGSGAVNVSAPSVNVKGGTVNVTGEGGVMLNC